MKTAQVILILVALVRGAAAQAQTSPTTIDAATAKSIVERVAAAVEENYVIPDTGHMVAEHLRSRVRAGAYDASLDPGRLADRLSADMKAVNGDLHLYVRFAPGPGDPTSLGAGSGPRMIRMRPGDQLPAEILAPLRRANYNVERADRLAGNVGYLSLSEVSARNEEAFKVLDAAMSFLERADAMIIDLRRTPGGDSRMSDYVASYFFGPDSVRTLTSTNRAMGGGSGGGARDFERWTHAVNGKQRPDIPVYILVGPGTASGAEDLAFIFKMQGRGQLVGERTAGAGRPTRFFPVGNGFTASVPGGRTYDPRTGKEWERVGIEPDIKSSADDALAAAHVVALNRLAASAADPTWKQTLDWTRENVAARAKPAVVPAATLQGYAGTYDLRVVRYRDGKLYYHRDVNRAGEELVAIDDHTFALGETGRVEFLRQGSRVAAVRVSPAPGQSFDFPRTP
jgi:hypothetical protein